jgi:hypothetical protein
VALCSEASFSFRKSCAVTCDMDGRYMRHIRHMYYRCDRGGVCCMWL